MTSNKKCKVGFFTKPINLDQEPIGIRDYINHLFQNILIVGKKIKTEVIKVRKKKHVDFNCPIIHRKSWAEEVFKDMQDNHIFYQKFKKPNDLAIIMTHNYKSKSLFEKSLDHLGIEEYTVLSHPEKKNWNHIYKEEWTLEYLKSGKCQEDLILYCDSSDCIMIDNPQKIVGIFSKFNCELLFMSTSMVKGYPTDECRRWAEKFNCSSTRHLNAGVFIGKKRFLIKFFEDFLEIVKAIQLQKHHIWKSLRDYYKEKNIQAYSKNSKTPKVNITDQNIIRYMHPNYPQIKIDINNSLACRNYKHFWGYFGKILKFLY